MSETSSRRMGLRVGLITLATALAAVSISGSAASAETTYIDQRYVDESLAVVWEPSADYQIGQPFIPESTGAVVDLTVWLSNVEPHSFAGGAIYAFPIGGDVANEPIPGGVAQLSISDTPDPSVAGDRLAATLSFPDRPVVTEGERYLLMLQPELIDGKTASFTMSLVFSGVGNLGTMTKESGVWAGYATSRLWLQLRMAEPVVNVVVTPPAPVFVPSTACGIPATVALPSAEGATYTQSEDGTAVTVTAVPADGYEFPADAVTSWAYDVAPDPCPTPSPTLSGGATTPPAMSDGSTLAATGASAAPWAFGVLLLAGGLLLASRRKLA
ncbi:hypothetical protein [Lysinibacter cavernae]|uniref:LPXTG cell wall anchor domain-containing protein n=1 Tax=Lysinibacter cavernae TaxID=1640652 RepID=A0A7X5TT70_9MICO|nr:hypothetical protein [Lysinibacter cavernae]NIH52988.1 hypothetical protein [Lysinibacter cavernae]